MIKNLKIISLLIYTFALTSLACVKKDGVVFISDDLDIESPIFDAVKKSEALAKRQEWLMQQEDSKDRKDIVTFVLSERYRIAAILDVSLK